jgi:excinuclease UvrABC nuclease subunit
MSRWIKFWWDDVNLNVTHDPGVYVIYLDGVISYVGQSSDISKRLKTHIQIAHYSSMCVTPWGRYRDVFVKVSYSKKYGDWAMRELRLIKKLQPQYNCVHSVRHRKIKNEMV